MPDGQVETAYSTLSQHFEMPPIEEFKRGLRSSQGRAQAYQILSSIYDMPPIEEFDSSLAKEVEPSIGQSIVEGLRLSSSGGILGVDLPPEEPQGIGTGIARGIGEMAGDIPAGLVGGVLGTLGGLITGPGAIPAAGAGYMALPEMVKQMTGRKEFSGKEAAKETLLGGATSWVGGILGKVAEPLGKLGSGLARTLGESGTYIGGEAALSGKAPTSTEVGTGIAVPVAMELGMRGAGKLAKKALKKELPPHIGIKEGQEIPGSPIANLSSQQLVNQEIYAKAKDLAATNPFLTQALMSSELGISDAYAKRILNQLETDKFIKPPDSRGRRFVSTPPPPPPAHSGSTEIPEIAKKEGHKMWKGWRYLLSPERATTENKGMFKGGRGHIEVDINNPKAQDISAKIVGTQLYGSQRLTDAEALFRRASHGLSEKEQEMVGGATELIGKTDPKSVAKLASMPEAVVRSATMLRDWFDSMKQDIRDAFRHRLSRDFSPSQKSAFDEAISLRPKTPDAPQPDFISIGSKYKVDPTWLTDMYQKYNDIDFWGMNDYVTKIEIGQYKVVDKSGQVRAVGETRREALKKLAELRQKFPDVKFSDNPIITEFKKSIDPFKVRKDILLGEKNIFKALPAYARSVYKKILIEPMDYDVRRYMDENPELFSQHVKATIEDQLDYARGHYAFGDKLTDQLAFRLGVKPQMWSRFTSTANSITAKLLLGWRLPNYFINLISGYEKTAIKSSPVWLKRAIDFMDSPQGKKFLDEEERLGSLALDVALGSAGDVKSTAAWYDPIKVYSMAEPPVRKFALVAPYIYAKGKLGLPEAEAREYARRSLRLTNFSYNTAALPKFLRSPSGKFFGQFKNYLAKETEFIHSLTPSEFAQHIVFQGLMTGARGFVLFAKSIPVLGALGLLDKLEEGINQSGNFASRGIPGMLGFDIAPSATVQVAADKLEDTAGPFVSSMIKLYQGTLGAYDSTKGKLENALDWAESLLAITRSWGDIISATISDDGWIYRKVDGKTKKVWKPSSDYDKLLLSLGFNPIGKSKQEVALRIWRRQEREAVETVETMRDNIVRKMLGQDQQLRRLAHALLERGTKGTPDNFMQEIVTMLAVDGKLDDEDLKDAASLGLTGQGLAQALKAAKTDPRLKEIMRANVVRKGKALELLQE